MKTSFDAYPNPKAIDDLRGVFTFLAEEYEVYSIKYWSKKEFQDLIEDHVKRAIDAGETWEEPIKDYCIAAGMYWEDSFDLPNGMRWDGNVLVFPNGAQLDSMQISSICSGPGGSAASNEIIEDYLIDEGWDFDQIKLFLHFVDNSFHYNKMD